MSAAAHPLARWAAACGQAWQAAWCGPAGAQLVQAHLPGWCGPFEPWPAEDASASPLPHAAARPAGPTAHLQGARA